MAYMTLMTAVFEAASQEDAEHLASIMVSRLDDLTPDSTKIKGTVVRPIEPSPTLKG